MSEEEKGTHFLELIDKQNNLQWKITMKLTALINSKWTSPELQKEIELLVQSHSKITNEINRLE